MQRGIVAKAGDEWREEHHQHTADSEPAITRQERQRHEAAVAAQLGLALDDFEGPRYKRIAHIKMLLAAGKLDNSLRWSRNVKVYPVETYGHTPA